MNRREAPSLEERAGGEVFSCGDVNIRTLSGIISRRKFIICIRIPGCRFTLPWAELTKAFSLKCINF